jgi:NAD(P)-dependent dehydrogenase (short-subunit alcohol dehydrogenase family)
MSAAAAAANVTSCLAKTVLITGGNRGLGLALVQYFVEHGWNVLTTARRITSFPETLSPELVPMANRLALDLASHDSVVQLSSHLVEERRSNADQRIDCIIHNAGFNPKDVPATERPAGYFESTFYADHFSAANVAESMLINALHPMELTGRLWPILAKDCAVIAISSWLGSIGEKTVPGHYGYTGSKALLNMCIKGLSLEFAKQHKDSPDQNNRVALAINPGWMQTDMGGGARADIAPTDVAQRIFDMVTDPNHFLQTHNGAFVNTDRSLHAW